MIGWQSTCHSKSGSNSPYRGKAITKNIFLIKYFLRLTWPMVIKKIQLNYIRRREKWVEDRTG